MEPNSSRGSMVTYARWGCILNNRFTANLLPNLLVKELWKSVKIWQNYGNECDVQFFGLPYILVKFQGRKLLEETRKLKYS